MGRINKYSNGNWVNQHRKSQGKFLEEQDIESHLLSNKLNNGNNIQEKTTQNIDDLPNIPAMLNYALNLPKQNSIDPIDGGAAHTPITQALLPFLTALSAAFPNTTAPPNKAIDNSNSSLSRVTSPTKVNTPVLFGTTPSTSQNHAQSKKLTKHSDDPSLIREKDGLIRHDDGNIILGSGGSKLTVSYGLNTNMLKKQLENSNITELCLWEVAIDPQTAQEIGEFLKDSNVKVLSILHGSIKGINFRTMLTDTKVTILNLAYNGIGNKGARGLIESLKETNVEELNLSDNRIGNTGKGAKGLLTLLKKTNVKVLDLSHNNMSDKKVNDIIPELEKNTKIIVLGLKDTGIEHNTLKKVLKVLKQNKHVNKEPTSTIKSSTTEKESSTEEDHTSNKREKRDIHTTDDETLQQESTVLTTDVSSTTTTESTTSATEDSTTTEQETTVPTVEEFSTTTKRVTTSSAEDSTTPEKKTTTPIMEKSSTTTMKVTTSSTEGSATTEQETTVPTTDGSSTTTTKSTASSAGNPTTDSATVWSNPQKTTTLKKKLTEKSEPIAADVVVDSITEKHTPKESNPNDPASSTMSIEKILGLISFAVTTIGVGGGVVIYAIKKFCSGVNHLGHEALALADLALVELDNRLDNNEETSSLTGITVNDDMD